MSGDPEDATKVVCRFIRGRNALLAEADFGPVFMDCYLHLGRNGVVLGHGIDGKLKLLLAAIALHAATLPRAVTCAWTLHLEGEGINIFAVAENPSGRLTGQVLSKQVRSVGGNVLHAELASAEGLRRRSAVEFAGDDILRVAEQYYALSEQRPARFFDLGGDALAIVAAQPDCDLEWLERLTVGEVRELVVDSPGEPLETRCFRFECGCTPARIAEAVGPALRGSLEEVFGGEDVIRVACPRCGERHELPRGLFGGNG